MTEIEELKKEIEKIKERNRRVERDKAWETSSTRRISVAVITYLFMILLMVILRIDNPLLSAVIPTCGFILSTLSVGVIKELWLRNKD